MSYRILIAGKGKIAIDCVKVLRTFNQSEFELIAVVLEAEINENSVSDYFRFCHNNEIPILTLKRENEKIEFNRVLDNKLPNLIISAQFSLIFSKDIVERFKDKIINIHNSFLPFYRGMAPISHAICKGEKTHGVTLHLIDFGIDTGPILNQIKFSIENLTNYEVYILCIDWGATLLKESIPMIFQKLKSGESLLSMAFNQDHKYASYFSKDEFDYTKTEINFNKSSYQIINQLRCFTFPPILFPTYTYKNRCYKIVNWKVRNNYPINQTKFGTILEDTGNKFLISTRDYPIELSYE